MKVFILFLSTILVSLTDARYVTRASRDLVRHIKHKMERTYGLGLTGLIHPVTKEFNHAAVIEQRGGRKDYEKLGNTKDIGLHTVMGSVHNLLVQAIPGLISSEPLNDIYDIAQKINETKGARELFFENSSKKVYEEIVQNVQQGIRSRFYHYGRYATQREQGTHHFHSLLAADMNK